jgi:hypothetical protein
MLRDIVLWLAGVPIIVIILLHLIGAFGARYKLLA